MRRFKYYRKPSLFTGGVAAATRHRPHIIPPVSRTACDGWIPANASARQLSTLAEKIRSSISPFLDLGIDPRQPEKLMNYPPSETPLRCLEKLFLRDLTCQRWSISRKPGRYLLLRTANLAIPGASGEYSVLVEDEKSEGLKVQVVLHNIKPKDTPLRDFLPQGAIFVVKEPVVVPIQVHTGHFGFLNRYAPGLRVDHLNDIVFYGSDAFNEVIKIPAGWRPQSSEGVVMRKMVPQPKWKNQLRTKKARIQQWVKEAQGVFDFQAMREEMKKDPQAEPGHASYMSNSIEVKPAGQMGRGLFAAKDIQAGELLLCERAFKVVHGDSQGDESHMTLTHRLLRDSVHHLNANPQLGEELLRLVSSGNFGSLYYQRPPRNSIQIVDGKPVIDSCATTYLNCSPVLITNTLYAFSFQIHQVLILNAFNYSTSSAEDPFRQADLYRGLGLWIDASLFNHSCYPNVIHSFLSNMILARAACDIVKGDQLFIQYNTGSNKNYQNTYEERQVGFQDSWGFQCRCQVCEFEASEDPRKRAKRTELDRGTLMPLLNALDEFPIKTSKVASSKEAMHRLLAAAEVLLKELEMAYAGSPPPYLYPRHILAGAHLLKYQIYSVLRDDEGVFLSSLDVLDALGYSFGVSASEDNIAIKQHGYALPGLSVLVAFNAWFMSREASSGKGKRLSMLVSPVWRPRLEVDK